MVFAGLCNGEPIALSKEYGWDRNRNFVEFLLQQVPRRGHAFLGEHEAMDAAAQRALLTGAAWERDPMVWGRELIEIAIEHNPGKIGPPVCVAALSPQGIARECQCYWWQRTLARLRKWKGSLI